MDYENDSSWVQGMLHPGENLIWTGRPQKLRFFQREDLVMIPTGIVMIAFGVFLITRFFTGESGSEAPLFAKVFMGFWLFSVVCMTFARPAVNYLRKRKQRYALTSQRVIVDCGRERRTLELTKLPPIRVTQRSDGSGSIFFGENAVSYGRGSIFGTRRASVYWGNELALWDLADVNQVEYRIRSAADQAVAARNAD